MDNGTRELERRFREAPDAVQAGLAYATSLARAGRKEDAFGVYSILTQSRPQNYNEIVREAIRAGLAERRVGQRLSRYAEEVHAVQRATNELKHYETVNGILVPRMPTFEENIYERVEDFNTLTDEQGNQRTIEQRLTLFRKWLSSCSAAIYKAVSTKLKIDQMSPELSICIEEDFNRPLMEADYATAEGIELDSSKDIYSSGGNYRPLRRKQALEHQFWNTVVQNRKLLEEYIKIYFDQREAGMGVWTVKNPQQAQLLALGLNGLVNDSNANAVWDLNVSVQSLRVAQK